MRKLHGKAHKRHHQLTQQSIFQRRPTRPPLKPRKSRRRLIQKAKRAPRSQGEAAIQ
jgi:hypothetical protein